MRRTYASCTTAALLVMVMLLVPACRASSGSAARTPKPSPSAAQPGANLIGNGPGQFHRGVAEICADVVHAAPGAPNDFAAMTTRVTAAQAGVQAVTDRTAADNQVLMYLTSELTWLAAAAHGGLGKAGPPPGTPPALITCRLAGTAVSR